MKYEIELYLNNKLVEFSKDPSILLNYKQDELHNPTVVRNSWTKQIEIQGTNLNNDVFNHIWDLDRYQDGLDFNPIKKADFKLFVNGELFEKGYAKLDKVVKSNNSLTYSITLYGGLGQFFYNLTFDEDGGANTKKTLASLTYSEDYASEPDLTFTADKDSVYEAWGQLTGFGTETDPRWNIINFAPCYNGIPGDFSADKALVNNYQMSYFQKGVTVDNVTYTPLLYGQQNANGYSLATLPDEMTEWQTMDLRSYLQRPVLRMYNLIQACCQPENNGGFKVELDSHFFHPDNPYYQDSWLTLPLLKDLDGVGGGESEEITGATIGNETIQYNTRYYPVIMGTHTLASMNNVNMNLRVMFNPTTSTSGATDLYSYWHYRSKTHFTLNSDIVNDYWSNTGIIFQLFAFDGQGNVVGQSKAYLLGGDKYYPGTTTPLWNTFYKKGNDLGAEPEYEFIEGYWHAYNGKYEFVNTKGDPTYINFSFRYNTDFATIAIKMKSPFGSYATFRGLGTYEKFSNEDKTMSQRFFLHPTYYTTGNRTPGEVVVLDDVLGEYEFEVVDLTAIATDYTGLFSGTEITKEKLLGGDKTPADYLISYCKMFGLYFYYDSAEEADDPERYPRGVVHIMDRDTFYTDEIVDLSKMIDYSQKLTITPATATAKWYSFSQEQIDSDVAEDYREVYGRTYGQQLVDTNYNFDNNTTELYDGNAFKAGITARKKDKYFKFPAAGVPCYIWNGVTYELFARGDDGYDSTELEVRTKTTSEFPDINTDGLHYFDCVPKLVCHSKDNSAEDGQDVLLFYYGGQDLYGESGGFNYWLTDDVADMIYLNDAEATWLLTKSEFDVSGNRIAYPITILPYFTRELVPYGQKGFITHSWNFGHPQATFIPETFTTDGDSIYDKCWRNYIGDMYDENTRKLTCYVRAEFDGRPWPYWLRRFYWFENALWRLNEIKDLNMASFGTTQMEFIKVQDMDDYSLDRITYGGENHIELDAYSGTCDTTTVTGRVYIQSGGGWSFPDFFTGIDGDGNRHYVDAYDSAVPHSGSGAVSPFTITLPTNTGSTDIDWEFTLEDDYDRWLRVHYIQQTCGTPPGPEPSSSLEVTPSSASVSYASGTTTFTITASNVSGLSASSSAAWAVPVINGNTLSVQYSGNTADSSRTATVTVSGTGVSGTVSDSVSIIQAAYVPPVHSDTFEYHVTTYDIDKFGGYLETYLSVESANGSTSVTGYTDTTDTDHGGGEFDVSVYDQGNTTLTITLGANRHVVAHAVYGYWNDTFEIWNDGYYDNGTITFTLDFERYEELYLDITVLEAMRSRASLGEEEPETE